MDNSLLSKRSELLVAGAATALVYKYWLQKDWRQAAVAGLATIALIAVLTANSEKKAA